jgi:hypothetical protein
MTPAKNLVVEDQRVVAHDIAEHLTRLRYAVLGITPSGEEAVRPTAFSGCLRPSRGQVRFKVLTPRSRLNACHPWPVHAYPVEAALGHRRHVVMLTSLFEVVDAAEACAGPGPVAEKTRGPFPKGNDVQRTDGVTWGQLVELAPQIQELLWRARVAGANCRTSLDVERAFGPVKN